MSPRSDHADVIDLTEPGDSSGTEVVRLDSSSPFEHLPEKERARLIVRVLCELVAYGHDEADESLSA